MRFFTKYMIMFHATRKTTCFKLAFVAVAMLVLYFSNHKDAAGVLFWILLAILFYGICMTVSCRLFRRSHHKFRVYYSFSERRQAGLSHFITKYLSPALWLHNIDYYDFREGARINFFNEQAVCAEINKNLANSDIFVRFVNDALSPDNMVLVKNTRYNTYARQLQACPFDYAKYEIDVSYDRFGFTAPYNRFQIVPLEIGTPKPHVCTIRFTEGESALNFALKTTQQFIAGYNKQQQRMLNDLFYMRYENKYNQGV